MRIREIVEPLDWHGFKGVLSSRVWFSTRTGRAITAAGNGNHSTTVADNPELFGLTSADLEQVGVKPGEKILDYDGRILWAAMQKGWVRIYVDARTPDLNSNAEGLNLAGLRRAFLWYCEEVGTPRRFVLVVRHGSGDKDGSAIVLNDPAQMEFFIARGSLPRDRVPDDNRTQVKQIDTTPHFFKKITD